MRHTIANLRANDLDVKYETLLGEPFVELSHAVQAEGYDLVLTGTRGLSAWEQFLVVSTAKWLIRKCPASVWIVKAEHVGQPKVILSPTDFSEVSLKAAAHGLWIAKQSQAQFHLLHIIDSHDVPENIISRVPEGSTLRNEINGEARAHLENFLDSLEADRSRIQVHLSCGTPWKVVSRFSQHLAADLIAMGTVGRSGIRGILLVNTAERILSTCDCSILTVKPDNYVSPIQPAGWQLHPEN
jgi:nucleotide-binding universal stress UspA family protein